jgi:hypothetical protein
MEEGETLEKEWAQFSGGGVGNPKLKCTQLFSPLAQTIGVVWVATEISVSI